MNKFYLYYFGAVMDLLLINILVFSESFSGRTWSSKNINLINFVF